MMTMWHAWKESYAAAWRFCLLCPLLAAIPLAFEFAQHAVEMGIGMYASPDAVRAAEHHPLRTATGYAKILVLILVSYWIARFMAGHDQRGSAQVDAASARAFAPALAFQVGLALLQLQLIPHGLAALAIVFVGGQVVGILMAAWIATAPLGRSDVGPLASARIMAPRLLWTYGFFLTTMLPLMIPHYALAILAVGREPGLQWPLMALDSVLVAYLAAVLPASGVIAARLAMARRSGHERGFAKAG